MIRKIPTVIVSGFPGIGKTTYAKIYPQAIRDLESSDYHLFNDLLTGEKKQNPDWPGNYIEAIKNLDKSGMYRRVLVSSHQTIRTAMKEAGIKYTNIYPEDSKEMMDIMLKRYEDRGSPKKFIEDIRWNWKSYIGGMHNDSNAIAHIMLTPKTLEDWMTWCMMG